MLTTRTIQLDDVITSEHESGGVQQGHRRGPMEQKLNPEMGVLSTSLVLGAVVEFDQRGLAKVDPLWEECRDHIEAFQGSTLVATDGGCEVMAAGLFVGGIAVKRRGESGCCWLTGFGRETKSVSAIYSPLSHLFLSSQEEQAAPIRSGAAQRSRIQIWPGRQ